MAFQRAEVVLVPFPYADLTDVKKKPMKAQYDFNKAQRGKFYHEDAVFHYPVDIESVNEDMQPAIHLRLYGLCAGEFVVPDDFDDPLPVEILKQFE